MGHSVRIATAGSVMGVILGSHDASNAPLVGGVRVEAIAPMGEKDVLVDDAGALPVLSLDAANRDR